MGRNFLSDRRRKSETALLEKMLSGLTGDETVMDLGAGNGFLSLEVAGHLENGRVFAVDLSQVMLDELRQEAAQRGLSQRVETRLADAAGSGLEDESMDLVISSMMLHEVQDHKAIAAEMVRVLRPGGRVVLKDVRDGWFGLIVRVMHGFKTAGPLTPDALAALFADAGLEDIEVVPDGRCMIGTGRKSV